MLLFFLGRILEAAIGTPHFVAIYFASLFAGSLQGALIGARPTPSATAPPPLRDPLRRFPS